jgi:glycosyltransferase involved in cell wall biosynthesis
VDLVQAHQYTPFFYAMLARLLYRPPAIIFTEHGRHYPDYPRRKRMLVNRLLLERRDRVVGVGEAVRQALIVNEGIPAPRVSVIYNGVDLRPYSSASESSRLAVRQELGLNADDLVIMQVARLDYLKDHATAIRAMDRVVQKRKNARLVLVGEGPERDAIQKQVQESNLGPYVRLLGLRGDVPRLLAAADLFLLTSISEGIPLTIIEAMAAGIPVVATQVGGLAEMIEDGKTGFLAPAGDPDALAERILRVADNPALRAQFGCLARDRASQIFSEDQMHLQYKQLFQECLPFQPTLCRANGG